MGVSSPSPLESENIGKLMLRWKLMRSNIGSRGSWQKLGSGNSSYLLIPAYLIIILFSFGQVGSADDAERNRVSSNQPHNHSDTNHHGSSGKKESNQSDIANALRPQAKPKEKKPFNGKINPKLVLDSKHTAACV